MIPVKLLMRIGCAILLGALATPTGVAGQTPVLRENLIRPGVVDFLTFGRGLWGHDLIVPSGPSDPPWDGSIPPLAVG